MSNEFDPGRHLMKVKGGAEYLEVKWRIVWLRDRHPGADIETKMMHHDDKVAVFRARVTIPNTVNPDTGVVTQHGGSATGWGSETPGDFRDYIEKAETKALGRALAALGFGTQFTGDDLNEGGRIVDAPVQRQPPRGNAPQAREVAPERTQPAKAADDAPITPNALNALSELAKRRSITVEDLDALILWSYNADLLTDLTIAQGREIYTTLDKKNPSELAELIRKARAAVADDNTGTQAMIADFDSRHPADSAKFRQ
jgi:hypothetical protein